MSGAISPFLMMAIPAEAGYTKWATSLLASSTFAGMSAGSLIGGLASDAFGPGRVIIVSLVLLALAGVAPVLSPSVAILARALCGIALCTIYQASNAYVAEWIVTSRRSIYLSTIHVGIALGGVATTLLAVFVQAHHDDGVTWRHLAMINSTPPLLVLLAVCRFVHAYEAPRFLLVSGTPGACHRMLRQIAREGGGSLAMHDFRDLRDLARDNGSSSDLPPGGGAADGGVDAGPALPPIALQLEHSATSGSCIGRVW